MEISAQAQTSAGCTQPGYKQKIMSFLWFESPAGVNFNTLA